MNEHYKIRRELADIVRDKISDLVEGIILVGSVAYNPEAVREDSDLNLVTIVDFKSADLETMHKRLGLPYDEEIMKHNKMGLSNMFNIKIPARKYKFKGDLDFWDISAFRDVTNLSRFNTRASIYCPNGKRLDLPELSSLRGRRLPSIREEETTHSFAYASIYFQSQEDLYISHQIFKLLLNPEVLFQKEDNIVQGLKWLKINLKDKIKEVHMYDMLREDKKLDWANVPSEDHLCIYRGIPDIESNLPEHLKTELKNLSKYNGKD